MSKILDATCDATGLVTAEGAQVIDALVLSNGKKASSGLLFMEDEKSRYLPSSATDIADLIQAMSDILTNVVTVLTAHDSALGSTQTATIAQITSANAQLVAMKGLLK